MRKLVFLFFLIIFPLHAIFARFNIDPEVNRFCVKQGKKVKGRIYVQSDESCNFNVEIEDWTHEIKEGVEWVRLKPAAFTVEPGKKKKVKWSAKIPKDADGDLTLRFFFSKIKDMEKGFSIGTRVASSQYITVLGTEDPGAGISEFKLEKATEGIFNYAVLVNTGNVRLSTRGYFLLEDVEKGTEERKELVPSVINRGKSLKFSSLFSEVKPGKYRAIVCIFYTDRTGTERELRKEKYFDMSKNGIIELK
ncbi:hypothetical protein ACFLUV_01530 [Elusimicrobiota bacterium]